MDFGCSFSNLKLTFSSPFLFLFHILFLLLLLEHVCLDYVYFKCLVFIVIFCLVVVLIQVRLG